MTRRWLAMNPNASGGSSISPMRSPFLRRCWCCGSSCCGSSACRHTCCPRHGPWRALSPTASPSLLIALEITAEESAGGLVASIVVGVLIALIFAQSRWVRRMLYPYTLLLQTVPIVAIAPLILMWVGAGTASVTLIAFIISLAPIIANTTQGLISVDENLVHLFLMHNASPAQILFKLRLPHAVPSLFVGIRIASGIAVIGAIHRRAVRRIEPRRRGRTRLFHSVCVVAAANRLSVRAGAGGHGAGLRFFFLVMFLEWYFLHNGTNRPARRKRTSDYLGPGGEIMLRLETETGWWLVTHPDHARLAGAFAERWGNERFLPPEPRAHVLKGIARHDDGWLARDATPQITRQGKPSAFSVGAGRQIFGVRGNRPRGLSCGARSRRAADRRGRRLRRGAHFHAYLQPAERACRPLHDRAGAIAAARPISGAAEGISSNRCASRLRRTRFSPAQSQRSRDSRSLPPACRRPTISRC